MPRYAIFMIADIQPVVKGGDDGTTSDDPVNQKVLRELLSWLREEVKAEHIETDESPVDFSEETSVRIEFEDTYLALEAEAEKDGLPALPPPKFTVVHERNKYVTTKIISYITAKFPAMNDVIAWGQSCPLGSKGFALEIRQLVDRNTAASQVPLESRELLGDIIISKRKQRLEDGRMRRDADGTLWAKVEDEEVVKQLVTEAEKREVEADN